MRTKKKILIIHSSLHGGGAEKVLIDILTHFDYSIYDIELLLLKKEGVYMHSIPDKVKVLNVIIKSFPYWCNKILIKSNLYGLYLKKTVRSYFGHKHYDTIISFMEGPPAKCHSYLRDKGNKNISWIHTNLLEKHWSRLFFPLKNEEKNFYAWLDEIVFVSEESKTKFDILFGLKKGRVIYNLIDREAIRNKAKRIAPTKVKFTICNAGRLTDSKRQDRIVHIASILKEWGYDIDFWILGEGKLKKDLIKLAKEKEVETMVHFLGFQENPYAYINAADVFLLTSDYEGFSLVVAEALCLCKPVISTHITGPIEQLNNGKYGILTNHNTNEIAEAIKRLIDNPAILQEYVEKADYRGKTLFDINRTMKQVYETI
ncbi:MAG: glycosyltransferase [Dysgonomonas sp.]|nr:glycosyltransferase [Dysgonomonas sp.]